MTEILNSDNLIVDKIQSLINQNNIVINLTGRQRMLSQKIGFLCEMVAHNNFDKTVELQDTVDLFEASLQVILNGGVPPQLDTTIVIAPISEKLLFEVSAIKVNWLIYKKSAQNIVNYSKQNTAYSGNQAEIDMQIQLKLIENNGEFLLKSCNKLVLSCSEYYKNEILGLFNQQ
ncbi:MAG: hypothetical protein EAZ27_08675 [Cytophagales bacterium]|nr:MAG: hypothetical protein EAZ27_08675 [Cytophagales bacterium]